MEQLHRHRHTHCLASLHHLLLVIIINIITTTTTTTIIIVVITIIMSIIARRASETKKQGGSQELLPYSVTAGGLRSSQEKTHLSTSSTSLMEAALGSAALMAITFQSSSPSSIMA